MLAMKSALRIQSAWGRTLNTGASGARALRSWRSRTDVADGAVGWLLRERSVDVVLVGAERIAANGDLANAAGTYPLAVLAARPGVPFPVCAPLAAVDPTAADGAALIIAFPPAP